MRMICILVFLSVACLGCDNIYGDPPPNFKEDDLVGTWKAEYDLDQIDLIIIKDDQTYKQIYQEGNFSYESPWQEWQVEYTPDGKVYLRLKGMRYYLLGRELRDHDEGAESGPFYDANTEKTLIAHNEVILSVNGVPAQRAPRGIMLLHLVTDPDTVSASFILQE